MTTPTRTPSSSPPRPPPEAVGASVRRRRRLLVVVLVAVVALVSVGTWAARARTSPREPVVRFTQPIPADVELEARAAVADFVDVVDVRRGCIATADVELVRHVEGGDARYVAGDAVIEIEIPTTPARFRESLVHELAHHVEHECAEFAELRSAWIARSGGAWSGQERWEQRPSELWAESVVELALGERLLHGDEMPLDPALVALVSDWLAGEPIG